MKMRTSVFGSILLALTGQATIAQVPSGLSDLVGARAAGSETQMKARGYDFVKVEKGDDRSYTTWWNRDKQRCVTVATMDGRYDSITETLPVDFGHGAQHAQPDTRHDNRDGNYALWLAKKPLLKLVAIEPEARPCRCAQPRQHFGLRGSGLNCALRFPTSLPRRTG